MIEDLYPELLNRPYSFKPTGTSIPADRRPAWRIGLLVLLLDECSRGKKSSFIRLQVLDWSIRSESGRKAMLDFLERKSPSEIPVRFDPAALRAIQFGVAFEFFGFNGRVVALLPKGTRLADEIRENGIYVSEREYMSPLQKKFLEGDIKRFMGTEWGN